MVTPEMLLFLAGKMGLFENSDASLAYSYRPHKDAAQFGDLFTWAAINGLMPSASNCLATAYSLERKVHFHIDHDSTPDSIRAAAVVAVCRALGFAAMEATNVPD